MQQNQSFNVYSSKKSLLSIPNTDIGKVHNIIENYSSCEVPVLIDHSSFRKSEVSNSFDVANLGIMVAEPSQRLLSAYCAMSKSRPENCISFKEFYSNPVRRNIYSRIFGELDIEKVGFIGVTSSLGKSVLMISEWLNGRLYRIPNSTVGERVRHREITPNVKAEIESLHSEDYALYRKLLSSFEQRWGKYQERFGLHLDKEKKIKIHVGPPKTGTSAIQAWLNHNNEKLISEGVFYPNHTSDVNGVSSGNFERLISVEDNHIGYDGKRNSLSYFDDVKAKTLLDDFRKSHCDTLLLSSEHFYYYLIWLFSRFAGAEFIFYVRHPLAILESSFHQEVKRHNRTSAFFIPKSIGFSNLNIIKKLSKEFSVTVTYRYFDYKQFINGSLLSDFASTVGLKLATPEKVERLNTQYSPGAITLMQRCNAFAGETLRKKLDMFLQRDSELVPAFSFIRPDEFEEIQAEIMKQAEELADQDKTLSSRAMTSLVLNYKKPPTVADDTCNNDLYRVLDTLIKTQPSLARNLQEECSKNLYEENASEIYQYLKRNGKNSLGERIKHFFSKSR
ncbi:hypothetical protein BM527_16670 [Alteromonas sp. Mex14]|nr:hypothetical protein BM527_16670 [Alteromonas sp. Mex14]